MYNYVIALDQGTTSCRAILFDKEGNMLASCAKEFTQIYPHSGWVEHDAEEIWHCQLSVLRRLVRDNDIDVEDIASIGITNQRETAVVWDRYTGKPVYNAIVWQCRRTAPICEQLKTRGLGRLFKQKTGLLIDAYFSGTKFNWILSEIPGVMARAHQGDLMAGTIDSWLIWNLTGGKVHATDYTNASRTMVFNIDDLCWDEQLLDILEIPTYMMPEVRNSSGYFGDTDEDILGRPIPITGVAGDQQSALFGQACFEVGMAKNTYGTGCFLLMNTGNNRINSTNDLLTTIAWGINGEVEYALEGSVFVAGAAIQWLRDELCIIDNAPQTEEIALKVEDTNGVYLVPAFVGLGAPYWDMYARGTMVGITRGTNKNHIVRAALESIAYQTKDVLEAMQADSNIKLKELKVDGGASANNFLMQFQSDILNVPVIRPYNIETTAQGVAFLAGLAVGMWKDKQEISDLCSRNKVFMPGMDPNKREDLCDGWRKAVRRSMGWAKHE